MKTWKHETWKKFKGLIYLKTYIFYLFVSLAELCLLDLLLCFLLLSFARRATPLCSWRISRDAWSWSFMGTEMARHEAPSQALPSLLSLSWLPRVSWVSFWVSWVLLVNPKACAAAMASDGVLSCGDAGTCSWLDHTMASSASAISGASTFTMWAFRGPCGASSLKVGKSGVSGVCGSVGTYLLFCGFILLLPRLELWLLPGLFNWIKLY